MRQTKLNAFKTKCNTLRILVGLVAVVGMLALAPTAPAQNASVDTYGGSGGRVQAEVSGGPAAPAPQQVVRSGPLPFTGLDLGLVLGGGLVLIAVGAAMAKLASSEDSQNS